MKRCLLATGIFVALLLNLPLYAAEKVTGSAVHEYSFDNGFKLIIKEDHRAPVAIAQLWYKVGSAYEPNGITGISHMLEHMMFKGTKNHGPGEFLKIIAENGGQQNAMTADDYTMYFHELAPDRLSISLPLEAERMRDLNLSEQEFSKELNVVKEERRMRTDDNPQAKMNERFNAIAFITNPYRHPTIGWMNDINHFNIDKLKNWYNTWYAPNNATLVIVGDVNPEEVYTLVEENFGSLEPSENIPTIIPPEEPEPIGIRQIITKFPAKLPLLFIGYNTPSLKTADQPWKAYALQITSAILSGGNNGRLPRDLIRHKPIAVQADSYYELFSRFSNLFLLLAIPAPNQSIANLKTAILQQITKLQTELVSNEELSRVKAQLIAQRIYSKDSLFGQAYEIGVLETIGLSWKIGDTYADKINAITPQQIQAVAREFFIPNRLTIGILEPTQMSAVGEKNAN
ncbi:MAG: insulinase family protein [Proteobacteria bacterium]|nr:insulinase family protein [Pseudomonadota bacterium]